MLFFQDHPFCIYCGGQTPAEEIDHVPSRQLFVGRQWPEGFEFPTCKTCNRATARAEQNVALLSRIFPDPDPNDPVEQQDLRELFRKVGSWDPAFLEELRPSSRFIRIALRKRGIKLPEGKTTRDVNILKVDGPLVAANLKIFARKLISALHYKETGRIIPQTGAIGWRWYSNEQKISGQLPEEFLSRFNIRGPLRRANRDISKQFGYAMYGPAEDGRMAAYFASFRFSFAILGIVAQDFADVACCVPNEDILRPLPAAIA